ncbi:MAG: DUF5615 family PIN-like protein [Acidobacteriota bacterium]
MADLGFIANMNISPLTINELKKQGWQIVRVSEIMEANTKDIDLLNYARLHNKVLITQDLDFSALLAIGGYEKPSVINIRVENPKPDYITRRLIEIVSKMKQELEEGIIVSVDDFSVRYRNLPIKLD